MQRLPLSQDQEHSEALVKETSAVDKLESEYAVELDFGGTSTSQVLLALKGWRVGRGEHRGGEMGGYAVFASCLFCLMHFCEGIHNLSM